MCAVKAVKAVPRDAKRTGPSFGFGSEKRLIAAASWSALCTFSRFYRVGAVVSVTLDSAARQKSDCVKCSVQP